MRFDLITEHQFHVFAGGLVLLLVVVGMLGTLIYLERRGIRTYPTRGGGQAGDAKRKNKKKRTRKRDRSIK